MNGNTLSQMEMDFRNTNGFPLPHAVWLACIPVATGSYGAIVMLGKKHGLELAHQCESQRVADHGA